MSIRCRPRCSNLLTLNLLASLNGKFCAFDECEQIAVMVAKAVAQCFQPSIYDVIIVMKNLSFLPDIAHPDNHCCRADLSTERSFEWSVCC